MHMMSSIYARDRGSKWYSTRRLSSDEDDDNENDNDVSVECAVIGGRKTALTMSLQTALMMSHKILLTTIVKPMKSTSTSMIVSPRLVLSRFIVEEQTRRTRCSIIS
jgi:hypothetical protein